MWFWNSFPEQKGNEGENSSPCKHEGTYKLLIYNVVFNYYMQNHHKMMKTRKRLRIYKGRVRRQIKDLLSINGTNSEPVMSKKVGDQIL